jgi:hypothetical protein
VDLPLDFSILENGHIAHFGCLVERRRTGPFDIMLWIAPPNEGFFPASSRSRDMEFPAFSLPAADSRERTPFTLRKSVDKLGFGVYGASPRDDASGGKSMCFQSQFPHKSVNLVRIFRTKILLVVQK